MPRIAVAVSDLIIASRIEAAVRRLDDEPLDAASLETARRAIAARPDALVIDLQDRAFDPLEVIRLAAANGARVLAFGRHTEPGVLRAARDAGAARAVARSELAEALPAFLRSLADTKIAHD